jgi:4-carboxymuconolactone decarboxylase
MSGGTERRAATADRFRPLDPSTLAADQAEVYEAIRAGPRGAVPWIFHLFLESPGLAAKVQELGAFCRYRTGLPPRLSELAILIVARHWRAEYEWRIHRGEALKAGLAEPDIAALEAGRRPDFSDRDAALVYDFATAFFRAHDVPDAIFAEAVERFGRRAVVELTGILGYYSMLAVAIRVFRLPPEA